MTERICDTCGATIKGNDLLIVNNEKGKSYCGFACDPDFYEEG